MASSNQKGYNTRSHSSNKFIHSEEFQHLCHKYREELGDQSVELGQFQWSPLAEILFFYAVMDNKPAGINRHFNMMQIHSKFSSFIGRDISSDVIWDHLRYLYNMDAVNAAEKIPFPNEEVEFELPADCQEILQEKYGVTLEKDGIEEDSSAKSATSDCFVLMERLNIDVLKMTRNFGEKLVTETTGTNQEVEDQKSRG